jgi:hypothetical protein
VHHKKNPAHAASPTEPAETEEANPQENAATPPAAAVPVLEPRESSARESELKQQYQSVAQEVRRRLAQWTGKRLSGSDRRTLEDAHTFFNQSTHALSSGDLPRALNLARKANLLLDALE